MEGFVIKSRSPESLSREGPFDITLETFPHPILHVWILYE